MTDADDLALLINTLVHVESLQYSLEQAVSGISINANSDKRVHVFLSRW